MRSKGETYIINTIRKVLGSIHIYRDFRIGEARKLSVDVYIPAYNLAIEFDGIQHFKRVKYFQPNHIDFLEQKRRDKLKEEICEEMGLNLIRIKYNDIPTEEELVKLIIANIRI